MSSRTQIDRTIGRLKPGQAVLLKIRRTTREIMARIELGGAPDEWEIEPAVDRARRLLGLDVRPITPATAPFTSSCGPANRARASGRRPGCPGDPLGLDSAQPGALGSTLAVDA